jgi:hypothetical protein
MIFDFFKKIFNKKEEPQENFDKLYKADQNVKSEDYKIVEKVPMIKQLKK